VFCYQSSPAICNDEVFGHLHNSGCTSQYHFSFCCRLWLWLDPKTQSQQQPPDRRRTSISRPALPAVFWTVRLVTSGRKPLTNITTADTASAVVYYNGPAGSRTSPSDIGVVSEPARKWEGASRRTTLNGERFTSSIAAGAESLPKSQIAGSAKLGNEDFVCFVDGTTTFSFREGLLGLRETNCKADYWCASTSVGN
jgi:hypothetical protein